MRWITHLTLNRIEDMLELHPVDVDGIPSDLVAR